MNDEKKILVEYVGNADSNVATAAITFATDPDRPDIPIGGQGELTESELAMLQGKGYQFAPGEDGSSPSTAGVLPVPPTTSGAGSAAGPEGAAGSGDAGGGPASTTGTGRA